MTWDTWSTYMYTMQTVWSNEAWIWFLLFAFVTTYFSLNLTLAVIEESFSNEKQKLEAAQRNEITIDDDVGVR